MNYKKLLIASTLLAGAAGVASLDEAHVAKADTVDTAINGSQMDEGFNVDHHPVDPGFGQGEPSSEPLDPNFGQGEPEKPELDPGFGQGEPSSEPLDPNFGQGEPEDTTVDPDFTVDGSQGTSDKDENIDPDYTVDQEDPEIDPDFTVDGSQGTSEKDPNIDPDFNVDGSQGTSEKDPEIDPGFGVGDKKPSKPVIVGPTTPGAGNGIDDNYLIDSEQKDDDNKPETKPEQKPGNDETKPGNDEVKQPVADEKAPVKDVVAPVVPVAKADEKGNVSYVNDGRKSVIATAKEQEAKEENKSLLPQTGAKNDYAYAVAGTMMIMGASAMGLAALKRKKA